MLSFAQLLEEGFPLRLGSQRSRELAHFVYSKDSYDEVTEDSPLLGLDCEMVYTAAGKLEVARVCLVNEKSEVKLWHH